MDDYIYNHIEVWVWDWAGEPISSLPTKARLSEILGATDKAIHDTGDLVAIASINADTHECVFSWDRVNGWTKRPVGY